MSPVAQSFKRVLVMTTLLATALAAATPALAAGGPSTREIPGRYQVRTVVVRKADRQLETWIRDSRLPIDDAKPHGTMVSQFPVALGGNPTGDKEVRGDSRTPEGTFFVARKVSWSRYGKHKVALLLSYPGVPQADRALADGFIDARTHGKIIQAQARCRLPSQRTMLGSYIEIHGGGATDYGDWTLGCIAMEDDPMLEVYRFARAGCRYGRPATQIVVVP